MMKNTKKQPRFPKSSYLPKSCYLLGRSPSKRNPSKRNPAVHSALSVAALSFTSVTFRSVIFSRARRLRAERFVDALTGQRLRWLSSQRSRVSAGDLAGSLVSSLAGSLASRLTSRFPSPHSTNKSSRYLPVFHGCQRCWRCVLPCGCFCVSRLTHLFYQFKHTCADRLNPKLSCEPLAFLINFIWIILPAALLGGCAIDSAAAVRHVNPVNTSPLSLSATQALAREEHQWLSEATVGSDALQSGLIKATGNTGALQQATAIELDTPVDAEPVRDAGAQRLSLQATGLSLHALLYSLAGDAGLELVMNDVPDVPVTLSVQNVRLSSLLEQISRQAPVVWSIADQRLSIRADVPFRVTYPIDYLNVSRQSRSSVGLATRVGSISLNIAGDTGSGDTDNSSQTLIENESIHNFWDSLSTDLTQLLQPYDVDAAASVVINREAGLVSVWAKQHAHREVSDYLSLLTHSASRQVLIEATIVEVTLSDQFQAGVDWQALGGGLDGSADSSVVNFAQSLHGQPEVNAGSVNKLPSPSALLSAIHQSNSLGRISATLSLLQTFGDVKILSRPQIIAINNQAAVLKVVDNRVYFSVSVERQSGEDTEDITTATTIHTVPVGLVMSVTPFVASDNSVILNVRPTISRILGFVNDPNPALSQASVVNGVPEIQVREMESVLKVGDGQIAMIGGLMQQQQSNNESGVPGLSRLPGVGHLFRQRGNSQRKTELLVFMRPVVLPATHVRS